MSVLTNEVRSELERSWRSVMEEEDANGYFWNRIRVGLPEALPGDEHWEGPDGSISVSGDDAPMFLDQLSDAIICSFLEHSFDDLAD